MAWWQWLVGILLFIIALSVLIGIHELGHLAAAKAFKVYCFNYSIGFGPKLISSKRSKKHETIWSLRAIPLGGFVSMYGEGAELDTDEYVPISRSLEGIARYKRAIIISAGVILNFILGFVLIFCHNAFFDHISFNLYSTIGGSDNDYYGYALVVNVDNTFDKIKSGDAIKLYTDPIARVKINNNQKSSAFILDSNVTIQGGSDKGYILAYKNVITTNKADPDIQTALALYERKPAKEIIESTIASYSGTKNDSYLNTLLKTSKMANDSISPKDTARIKELDNYINQINKDKNARNTELNKNLTTYYSKITGGYAINADAEYNVSATSPEVINATINYYNITDEAAILATPQEIQIKRNANKNGYANTGIRLKRTIERYNFAKAMRVTGQEWCNANIAVFKGIGMLFTGSGQLTGFAGIAQMSAQTLANFGFERYLYLWGMISCNVAIFNLLPFPGLDGFSLVVIGYEAIRKKQVPTKVKGIMSLIGMALLFTLAIAVLIMDISRFV